MDFRISPEDFSRSRRLTLEHVVGFIMKLTLDRNMNGYDISSQNYFRELSREVGVKIEAVRHQSVSEARAKLHWEGFECLLHEANLEREKLGKGFKFKGHVTRAIDGTSFYTPRTPDLLSHFTPRNTKSEEGQTHYPYGLCVTAINVFTGQPVAALVGDYTLSERDLLKSMIKDFKKGDLSLLDRGLGGKDVYLQYYNNDQFFIHRTKTQGERVALYVQEFLASDKSQKRVKIKVHDPESDKDVEIKLRLVRGPLDNEGKSIVFVTNLLDKKRYSRQEIIELYQKRWSVETLYNRVKNLLNLEKFHAKTHNGVMQEIFANLLALSLSAVAVLAVIEEDELDPEADLPNFKNATEVVRSHLFSIVDQSITKKDPHKVVQEILDGVRALLYKIRPGRSYPRVSMQPIKSWNLKKSAKLKAFRERKAA
jgi:hypothetical protein